MIYSRIVGTGSFLPPRVMTNQEFAARLNTSDEWIRTRTGIVQRHIADKSQASSDLRRALQAADTRAGDLDLIVLATSTPDYVFPSTACLLQAKLGIKGCAAFDVQAVCSGFVYALATADAFIKSGTHKRALVIGAEVFSRILDWNDRGTCVLFGDGAGAAVLAAGSKPGVHASVLRADGSHAEILSVPGNVCGGAIVGTPFLRMDGQAVFKFAVRVLEESDGGGGADGARGRRLADSTPGERAHPRGDRAQAGSCARQARGHSGSSRQHVRRLGAARAG